MMTEPQHVGAKVRQRAFTPQNIAHDLRLAFTKNADGERILDFQSLLWAYRKVHNPVRVVLERPGVGLVSLRYTHNIRTNAGGKWLGRLQGGDLPANLGYISSGNQTYTATTITPTVSPAWTVNQWVDHIVVPYAGVYGVCLSNTATAITVDQWTTVGSSSGAAGSTPAANTEFNILPGAAPALWVALSTDATAPSTTDTTLASELTSTDLKRRICTWSETTTPSGSSTSVNQTETWKFHNVYTLTTTNTGIQKAGMFTGQNGSSMAFSNVFAGINTISGDSATLDWAVTNA